MARQITTETEPHPAADARLNTAVTAVRLYTELIFWFINKKYSSGLLDGGGGGGGGGASIVLSSCACTSTGTTHAHSMHTDGHMMRTILRSTTHTLLSSYCQNRCPGVSTCRNSNRCKTTTGRETQKPSLDVATGAGTSSKLITRCQHPSNLGCQHWPQTNVFGAAHATFGPCSCIVAEKSLFLPARMSAGDYPATAPDDCVCNTVCSKFQATVQARGVVLFQHKDSDLQ